MSADKGEVLRDLLRELGADSARGLERISNVAPGVVKIGPFEATGHVFAGDHATLTTSNGAFHIQDATGNITSLYKTPTGHVVMVKAATGEVVFPEKANMNEADARNLLVSSGHPPTGQISAAFGYMRHLVSNQGVLHESLQGVKFRAFGGAAAVQAEAPGVIPLKVPSGTIPGSSQETMTAGLSSLRIAPTAKVPVMGATGTMAQPVKAVRNGRISMGSGSKKYDPNGKPGQMFV